MDEAEGRMTDLCTVLRGLEAVGLMTGVAHSAVTYAAVSAGHIIGIALLLGPVALADLHLAGLMPQLEGRAFLVLRRTAAIGAGIAAATGVLLLSARPFEYAGTWVVPAKLIVVATALANALVLEWAIRRRVPGASPGRTYASGAAVASIALWLTAVALGRWIAFV
jgi:hypothetical protein